MEHALLFKLFLYMHPDTIYPVIPDHVRIIPKAEQDVPGCHSLVIVFPEQLLEFGGKAELALCYFICVWIAA